MLSAIICAKEFTGAGRVSARHYRDGLKIRIVTYARCAQVLDLDNIAAPAFPGQNFALERGFNDLIPLMVHCRYRR